MPEPAPEVERLVRDWLDSKQAADTEAVRASLSDSESALAIGTEDGEWWSGASAFRHAHTVGGPFVATVQHVEAHRSGDVAWAAAQVTIETGEPGGHPVRLTLVLVGGSDGGWRIVQSHASTPEAV